MWEGQNSIEGQGIEKTVEGKDHSTKVGGGCPTKVRVEGKNSRPICGDHRDAPFVPRQGVVPRANEEKVIYSQKELQPRRHGKSL